jgi:tellurite resistance protein
VDAPRRRCYTFAPSSHREAREDGIVSDALKARGKALEDQFFQRENENLIRKLKATFDQEVTAEHLKAATGITNPELLERLIGLQVRGETLAAFWLSPLVEIAWADGKVDERERMRILEAAHNAGIQKGSLAHDLLEQAMVEKPTEERRKVWRMYAEDLVSRLDHDERRIAREELIRRARAVAEASGGILGMGPKISANEQKVLDAIARVFPD